MEINLQNDLKLTRRFLSLTFAHHRARLDLLVHEILFLSVAHVLVPQEVEVVAREVVQLVLHLPDLRLLDLGLGDGQRIGLPLCLA